ncbi:MAG: thiamine diphosphokinase [Rhodobacteraceae bacterium]|nr:thiamine diphosphokinase [Paracoccaceae bacterium]
MAKPESNRQNKANLSYSAVQPIICNQPVLLVGGAPIPDSVWNSTQGIATRVVAADGGADRALTAGRLPEAVFGDMDSISAATRKQLRAIIAPIAEQDTTDFDKALRHVEAPLVLALGVAGGRQDHHLAALHVLLRAANKRVVMLSDQSICYLCPPELALSPAPGSVFSLFPMGPVGVQSTGLRWPTDGLAFAPGRIIGTSNAALGPVYLRADAPVMLVIQPLSELVDAARALRSCPHNWPV